MASEENTINGLVAWWINRDGSLFWDHVYAAEVGAGVVALMILSLIFPSQNAVFFQTDPHPYLFLVFFIALRHGLPGGFVSGVLLTVVYLAGGYLDGSVSHAFFSYSTMSVPLQLLLTGAVTGELREQQIQRYLNVSEQLRETREKLKKVEKNKQQLETIRQKLQKRIASDKTSFYTLNEIFKRMWKSGDRPHDRILVDVISRQLDAESVVFYRKQNGNFVSSARAGEKNHNPQTLTENDLKQDPLIERALTKKSLTDVEDLPNSAESSYLYCSPIVHMDSVEGLILVGDMPFFRFHYRSKHLLHLFTAWFTHFSQRQERYKQPIL